MATGIFGDVQDSPFQSVARARTRSIFGVQVPDRALAGVASGLGSYDPQGGFFGNLARSLSGSLQGGMGFDRLAQERAMEDARLQMQVEQMAQQQANADRDYGLAVRRETRLGMPEPPKPDHIGSELELFLREPEKWRGFQAEKAKFDAGNVKGLDATGLSPEATAMIARNYAMTGQMPSLGMGAAQTRVGILNEAARRYPGADVGANRAQYDADKRTLADLQRNYDASTAFEQTAHRNADVLLGTAQLIPETGNRLLNKAARTTAAMLGSKEMSAFNTALETVLPEFARLLSSPGATGSAMLTDTARREMRAVLSGDFTKDQLIRSVEILKQDAQNRRRAYAEQIEKINNRIRSFEAAGGNLYSPLGGPGAPSGFVGEGAAKDPLGVR